MAQGKSAASRRKSPTVRNSRATGGKSRRRSADTGIKRLGVALAVLVAVVIVLLIATAKTPVPAPVAVNALDLDRVVTADGLPEELLHYKGMTVSFNAETHQPNWVAWELLGSETDGETGRESGFSADESVAGCATPDDYRRSGYDRGHMAPAGDMKWNEEAMYQSFLMTNICPQAGELNRGAWKKLEEKCRQRAVRDSAVVIVCGPVFDKGQQPARIGATGVAVPSAFFKVILSPYSDPPVAIGFVMPNGRVVGGMQQAAVSVDAVEAMTGHDFFSALPDSVEAVVESRCDFDRWSRMR